VRRAERIGQRVEGADNILLRTREHVDLAVSRPERTGFPRIAEKTHRRLGTREHQMPRSLENLQRRVNHIGNPIDRHSPATARHSRHLCRRAQLGARGMRDAVRRP
jgi:hypothetical protein